MKDEPDCEGAVPETYAAEKEETFIRRETEYEIGDIDRKGRESVQKTVRSIRNLKNEDKIENEKLIRKRPKQEKTVYEKHVAMLRMNFGYAGGYSIWKIIQKLP